MHLKCAHQSKSPITIVEKEEKKVALLYVPTECLIKGKRYSGRRCPSLQDRQYDYHRALPDFVGLPNDECQQVFHDVELPVWKVFVSSVKAQCQEGFGDFGDGTEPRHVYAFPPKNLLRRLSANKLSSNTPFQI